MKRRILPLLLTLCLLLPSLAFGYTAQSFWTGTPREHQRG